MNIYIYSDESGVFDKKNNDIFVFGGLIFLDKETKEITNRKYIHAENIIRKKHHKSSKFELKASKLNNKDKYSLYRSLNKCYKFGVVVNQNKVLDRIFEGKKDKQRYLDYVYKITVKKCFEYFIKQGTIDKKEDLNIYFFIDEHTTATNGIYELKEALEQELKFGTYNFDYSVHYPPIFTNLKTINLNYCNSASNTLIRAADIVANHLYHQAISNNLSFSKADDYFFVIHQP